MKRPRWENDHTATCFLWVEIRILMGNNQHHYLGCWRGSTLCHWHVRTEMEWRAGSDCSDMGWSMHKEPRQAKGKFVVNFVTCSLCLQWWYFRVQIRTDMLVKIWPWEWVQPHLAPLETMTATSRDGTTRSKTFLREMYKNSPLTKPLDTTPRYVWEKQ